MKKILVFLGFMIVATATRLLPHAPNFTAVGALALFAGTKFPGRWAWFVPLLAMFASDAVIGFYDWKLMLAVYASFLAFVGIGKFARKKVSAIRVAAGSLAGSTLFFLTTNFAVWLMSDWYPRTFGGLMLSYAYGVPFFRNMVFGDLFYTGVFFGAYAFLSRLRSIMSPVCHSREGGNLTVVPR